MTDDWTPPEPIVCGTEPRSRIIDENECRNCERPIYRTKWHPAVWRHQEGFATCFDPTRLHAPRPLGTKAEPAT